MEDVNIHTFRHTFASYLVMSGVDIVTLKELLGHSEIAMTMRYAHLVPPQDSGCQQDLRSDAGWHQFGAGRRPGRRNRALSLG